MKMLVYGGTVVNEGRQRKASVIIEDDRIAGITEGEALPRGEFNTIIDASGSYVLPGVIDSHVHFREPGLTHKADIASESRVAAYGGVTSFFDMPNTDPQTTSSESLEEKFQIASRHSHVNYSFFPGATNTNEPLLRSLDATAVPGIKLFMGSSTGNMLVDRREAMEKIFATAAEKGLVLMAHCEDTAIINSNMARLKASLHTDDPDISFHPVIRDAVACYESTRVGVELAKMFSTRFHVAHVSTEQELDLLGGTVTGEACVAHLLFDAGDYAKSGALIKCNPAIKSRADRDALRRAIKTGVITTVSTDHAPHLLSEKQGGAARAMSGMPMLQFSLPAMLTLADEEGMAVERIVDLMCHNQATLFGVAERGFLRKGYKADIAIVRREPWTVTRECVQSKCHWSPLEGRQMQWKVTHTICNGHLTYNLGTFDSESKGERLTFIRQ